ncbi:MAG TPA: AraC family transcriptional regulator [Pyrinomonadaceae bacterium]|nr:AraC family transcriptional regulator [Pyrinomonadaceae bacterium]
MLAATSLSLMLITLGHNTYSRSEERIIKVEALREDSSYILKTGVREYYGEIYGTHLSLRSASAGRAIYETCNSRYLADKDAYLLLNPGQHYSLTVSPQTGAEGIIIFFADGFAEEVCRSLTAKTTELLDEPQFELAARLEFIQRLYAHDNILSPLLSALLSSLDASRADRGWYEEQLHRIMQQLLRVHWNVRREIAGLPLMRAATREEIYRRVYRARDYIASSIEQPLTLGEMARIACLSPNHFMRSFRQVFRVTPHQYLTALRLEKARSLLDRTEISITEICFLVGFESLGSFSWLFRRRVGMSPEAYRRRKRESRA